MTPTLGTPTSSLDARSPSWEETLLARGGLWPTQISRHEDLAQFLQRNIACMPSSTSTSVLHTTCGKSRWMVPFSRMRSRRVLFLRKSVQSVRKRSQAFAALKIVAKRRTVVTLGLAVNRHRDRGSPGREAQNCRHFWTRGIFTSQKCQPSQGSGGPGRETQNCRHFGTRVGSSRLKCVNRHRDRVGPGRETQNCDQFWTRFGSSRLKSVNRHNYPIFSSQLVAAPTREAHLFSMYRKSIGSAWRS